MKQLNSILPVQLFFFSLLFSLLFIAISCDDDSSYRKTNELTDLEILTRDSDECCAEISGPSSICTDSDSEAPTFCVNTCCEDAEITWSGHPSINGLNTHCIFAPDLDESVDEIHVEVKCPIDLDEFPDIPGDVVDFCLSEGTKSIKVCSAPPFTHPNPPLELQNICFRATSCFDFSNATCFTNINIIDQHPGLIVSAEGSSICMKAKLCSRERPFIGFVELQFQGPCGDGEIELWDNIQVGQGCPDCSDTPIAVDCEIAHCPCEVDTNCPTGFKCGPEGYCIKKLSFFDEINLK